MSVCIFLGPTLPLAEAQAILPTARFLPPVRHGDVHDAVTRFAPAVLGIVDGYFQHTPSVWHKEILWALERGVRVYGAASMGALRAAELETFGMTGVGAVFEAYRAGALPPFDGLTDDDEVAVVHGPAETGYVAVSDAMVNIRHTLAAAVRDDVVDRAAAESLIAQAKRLHFPNRRYEHLLDLAQEEEGMSSDTLARLRDWLPNGRIDQKRADARALLERIATRPDTRRPPSKPPFRFEVTEIWDGAVAAMRSSSRDEPDDAHRQLVLDELRLREEDYRAVKRDALACLFCTEPAIRHELGRRIDRRPLPARRPRELADEFRRENALLDRRAVDDWLRANDLDTATFDTLIRREARFERSLSLADDPSIAAALIERLRIRGLYAELSSRAACKANALERSPLAASPSPQLPIWFFESRLRRAAPPDLDAYARRLGLADTRAFLALLSREYRFLGVDGTVA